MNNINHAIVIQLENNERSKYIEGINILLKLLDNIINDPQNSKFRTIKLENKTIKTKLLNLQGILAIMHDIGFVENAGQLTLPSNVLIANLKRYREFISERLNLITNNTPSTSSSRKANVSNPNVQSLLPKITVSRPFRERKVFPRVLNTNNSLLKTFESLSDTVMQYEDEKLLESGRKLIPTEKLTLASTEKLRRIQKLILSGKYKDDEPCLSDLLMIELVNWFKCHFFTWINKMPCKICGNNQTEFKGIETINSNTVEKYLCCNTITEFHRYNDIETLLLTRKGRCGEFANCFTFLARCLDYNARYVYSTEDHVWTEYYSHAQKRWIHVDPSDNVVDSPYMYEHGWKKKIAYIIGFSNDDIQDVTWRYSNDHKKVLNNRKLCTEKQLLETILTLRTKRQQHCSQKRKQFLKLRVLNELVELMVVREPTIDEKRGRSSGSLTWRIDRGEEGNCNNFYVIVPSEEELLASQLNIRYSCSKDVYERYLIGENAQINVLETKKDWRSYHYLAENLFRKVENDWKMVYLARTEDTEKAVVQWKFDLSKNNLRIKLFNMQFNKVAYENGNIEIIYLDENDIPLNSSGLQGLSMFSVKAVLTGGKGDCAWQHTQLFRQSTNSDEYPFIVNIKFE